MKANDPAARDRDAFVLPEAIAVLERTPACLRALLSGLPASWTAADEGPDTWSPMHVLRHLIHGERVNWMPRARHILSEAQAPFSAFDRAAPVDDGQPGSIDALLTRFASLRRENLESLRVLDLTSEDLARRGHHPELGRVTLAHLLAAWTAHDLDHVAQIVRVMAKRYRTAVGPWSVFLSILRDRE